uniref:Uncharacterized protein n=1 Tax=Megaselia scalaris TaxID=36166 RepID=T1GHA8_MEGSC
MSLINVAFKILASIISERLMSLALLALSKRAYSSKIYFSRSYRSLEKQITTYHLFIDFRQDSKYGYSSSNNPFWYTIKTHQFNPNGAARYLYCVKVARRVSEKFQTLKAFRQGDKLSDAPLVVDNGSGNRGFGEKYSSRAKNMAAGG